METLAATYTQWASASRRLADARAHRDLLGLLTTFEQAEEATRFELDRLQAEHRTRFAAEHGWIVARRSFDLEKLSGQRPVHLETCHGVFDHPDYFTTPRPRPVPAALVVHTYRSLRACYEFATVNGLTCDPLPWSWYFPSRTQAALFRPRQNA